MPKTKYLVTLGDDEREQLEHLLRGGTHAGSDVHVMLALRRSSHEVVVTYEELHGTNMIGELLRKRQCLTYQA